MSNNHGQKLAGKIAVITGGSSGIGLATAKRFVEEGAHVVITGRREEELKDAAAFIKRNVTAVVGDVSRLEDREFSARLRDAAWVALLRSVIR